ncbi:fibrinogen like 1B isoform X3 [Stegostoma tigrinum]|uniref:fibrinogen like 1B isoform X3 n=1 Tax=Stegostoma tigrinum TaxID=3053191 RepID=UPI0028708E2D|nr:fibrinogen like 1B isoform X3 [Stegostoma tigrinum]
MMLLVIILLLDQSLAAHRGLDNETCMIEVSKLQKQLQHLQAQFLLGTWRLKHLKENNIYWTKKNTTTEKNEEQTTLQPNTSHQFAYHHDCSDIYNSGETTSGYYQIKPKSIAEPFLAYCDMSDGGGWTVIQRRSNGKVNFNRGWDDYKSGFGLFQRRKDEYWLGNEKIHQILAAGKYLLKFDLIDWNGDKRYATYEKFNVSDEMDKYRLTFGAYSGNAGDALSGGLVPEIQWSVSHNGMQFSTSDQDNDRYLLGSCSQETKSGWWFNRYRYGDLEHVQLDLVVKEHSCRHD